MDTNPHALPAIAIPKLELPNGDRRPWLWAARGAGPPCELSRFSFDVASGDAPPDERGINGRALRREVGLGMVKPPLDGATRRRSWFRTAATVPIGRSRRRISAMSARTRSRR